MLIRVIAALLLVVSCVEVEAQQKKTTQTQASSKVKKKQAIGQEELPPRQEYLEEVEAPPAPPLPPPAPVIDFDTTASPNDAFTLKIKELLTVTSAVEADVQAAEQSLTLNMRGNETNPMAQAFKSRFMSEMRDGRMRRWLESTYIRNYRATFTPEDIDALIAFYKTPAGQTIIPKQAKLVTAVMGDAQKIGAYISQTIMLEVINEQKK